MNYKAAWLTATALLAFDAGHCTIASAQPVQPPGQPIATLPTADQTDPAGVGEIVVTA